MSRGRGFRRNLTKLTIPSRPGGVSVVSPPTADNNQPQYKDYMVLEESKEIVTNISTYSVASHPDILRMCNTIRKYGETFDRMRKDDMDKIFNGFRDAIKNPSTHPSVRTYLLELVETRARQWAGSSHLAFYEKKKAEFMDALSKADQEKMIIVDLENMKPQYHPDRLDQKYSLNFSCPASLLERSKTTMNLIEHRTKTKISWSRGPAGEPHTDIVVKIWGASLNDIRTAARSINDDIGSCVTTPPTAPPTMSGDRGNAFSFSEPSLCDDINSNLNISAHPDRAPPIKVRRHYSVPAPSLPPMESPVTAPPAPVAPAEEQFADAFTDKPAETRSDRRRRPAPVPLEPPTVRLCRKDLAPVEMVSKKVQTDFLDQVVLRGLTCGGETGDLVIISGNQALLKNLQRKLLTDLQCTGYELLSRRDSADAAPPTPTVTTLRQPLRPTSSDAEVRGAAHVNGDAAKRRSLFARRKNSSESSGGYDRQDLLSIAKNGCAHQRPDGWDEVLQRSPEICRAEVSRDETEARLKLFELWCSSRLQPSPPQSADAYFNKPSFSDATGRASFQQRENHSNASRPNFNFSGQNETPSNFSFSASDSIPTTTVKGSDWLGGKGYVIPVKRSSHDRPSRWSPPVDRQNERRSPVDRVRSPPGFVPIKETGDEVTSSVPHQTNNNSKWRSSGDVYNGKASNPFSVTNDDELAYRKSQLPFAYNRRPYSEITADLANNSLR